MELRASGTFSHCLVLQMVDYADTRRAHRYNRY
jgi:hypothetical protein